MALDPGDFDRLLSDLARWSAERQTAEDAAARSRRAWLRRQATEETALPGLLLGWAEARMEVEICTSAASQHFGRVVAVGQDFVCLRPKPQIGGAQAVLIRLTGISWARRSRPGRPGDGAAPDGRPPIHPHALDLAAALAGLAEDRARVRLETLAGPELASGEIQWIGTDVLCLRTDADQGAYYYVPLASLVLVTVLSA